MPPKQSFHYQEFLTIAVDEIEEEESNENDQEDVTYNSNFTEELENTIQSLPSNENYIGCVNCSYPIAFANDIIYTIGAVNHVYIPIAYVLHAHPDSMVINYTTINNFSRIYWKTQMRCTNCSILLSIPTLNNYNTMIDEFSNEERCVIIDAWSVQFYHTYP